MSVISKQGDYVISSDFGASIIEGTESAGTLGKIIHFQIDQIDPQFNNFYWQIEPITGLHSDFWEDFFSNRIGGEPADAFDNSGFTSGSVELKINPDIFAEFDQKFKISFYLSNLDPYYGVAPVASATFTIIDDDPMHQVGNNDANTIETGSANDSLYGKGGDDTLLAGAGDDLLDGGTGIDTMRGGRGNDTYIIDNTGDLVFEDSNAGTDTVKSSLGYTLTNNVENLVLTGTHKIDGTGNAFANMITGNGAANTLNGAAGNDVLDGKAGADTMIGGTGNDTYVVDNAGDKIVESSGIDTVMSSVSLTLGANIENLYLIGSSNLSGTGNSLANSLNGNAGANVLNGGLGNDLLDGGLGKDMLIGGAGKDTFVFATKLSTGNVDHIRDFKAADDTIKLENAIFTALTKTGTLGADAFALIGSSKDTVSADAHILYDKANGTLYYDPNGGSASGRVEIAIMDNHTTLTHGDFLIV